MKKLLLLFSVTLLSCISSYAIEKNQILYTTTDGSMLNLYGYGLPTKFGTTVVEHKYENGQGCITFESDVTCIEREEGSWRNLESITLPDCITSLYGAFAGCSNLKSVNIPDALRNISDYTFRGCSSLTSITLPDSIQSIGYYSFQGCTSLTSINFPDSLHTIGEYAFASCTSLTSINLPDSLHTIGSLAFGGCTSLQTITIPEALQNLGSAAFAYCDNISTIVYNSICGIQIYNKYNHIGIGTYPSYDDGTSFSNLQKVILGKNVKSYDKCIIGVPDRTITYEIDKDNKYLSLIDGCLYSSDLKTILMVPDAYEGAFTIPQGLTKIGNYAFSYCDNVSSVTIPEGVTEIGFGAFNGCGNLTSVTIPEGVTEIGFGVFNNCSKLTSVTIPQSVAIIGDNAFSYCDNITSITIPEGVYTIGGSAFYMCSKITEIVLPNSVKSIGSGAFGYCRSLKSLKLPDATTVIPNFLCEHDSSLTDIKIPDTVEEIGYDAFHDCGMKTLILPKNLKNVKSEAFYGCKLREIQILATTVPSTGSSNDNRTFSNQSYYHTTLLVPAGTYDDYAYSDGWWKFINIKEFSASSQDVRTTNPYMLKDAETRSYIVYDAVNDRVGTISLDANMDPDEPNHSWQVIEKNGKKYIYNLGARKYLTIRNVASTRGAALTAFVDEFALTSVETPFEITDGETGVKFGSHEWVFVVNDNLNVVPDPTPTALEDISASECADTMYDLMGRKSNSISGYGIINGKTVLKK